MITVEQLYAGTREGLDIILSVYPQAEVCVSNPKAKFKARESERTPSAMLMATTDKNGNRVWKMIDYGDEGHALSPVDVWMSERTLNVSAICNTASPNRLMPRSFIQTSTGESACPSSP